MRWYHRVLWLAFMLAVMYFMLAAVSHYFVPCSVIHCVEARFGTMPPDDTALRNWLATEPTIVSHTVFIKRFKKDPTLLEVLFVRAAPPAKQHLLPDLASKCMELGYGTADGPFRTCTKTNRDGYVAEPIPSTSPIE